MDVAVDFSTMPEMFGRVTTKYARGERPVLMHKVDKTRLKIDRGVAGEMDER
jgi:hypothetical protein